jgi:hypothetical protein
MSDFFDFVQSNWYQLGSLIAQFAILAVAVWYARTSLRIRIASLHQAEPAPRPVETRIAFAAADVPVRATAFRGVGQVLSAPPTVPVMQAERAETPRVIRISAWRAMNNWLRSPWHAQANQRIVAASVRQTEPDARTTEETLSLEPEEAPEPVYAGVGRLLSPMPTAPVRKSEPIARPRVNQIGHWRAMINWLRAPIGSGRYAA